MEGVTLVIGTVTGGPQGLKESVEPGVGKWSNVAAQSGAVSSARRRAENSCEFLSFVALQFIS